jgi:hypothetical protein
LDVWGSGGDVVPLADMMMLQLAGSGDAAKVAGFGDV